MICVNCRPIAYAVYEELKDLSEWLSSKLKEESDPISIDEVQHLESFALSEPEISCSVKISRFRLEKNNLPSIHIAGPLT